jgi:hypothetical protein
LGKKTVISCDNDSRLEIADASEYDEDEDFLVRLEYGRMTTGQLSLTDGYCCSMDSISHLGCCGYLRVSVLSVWKKS